MMMPIFFADTPVPTSLEFGGWMLCLAAFLGILNQFFKAKQNLFGEKTKTQISPQPLSVRMEDIYATDRECQARHDREGKRIYDLSREIEMMRQERMKEVSSAASSRAAMYNRVEEVRKELTAHSENMRRELGDKIDQLPAQVIAILRNTGAKFS